MRPPCFITWKPMENSWKTNENHWETVRDPSEIQWGCVLTLRYKNKKSIIKHVLLSHFFDGGSMLFTAQATSTKHKKLISNILIVYHNTNYIYICSGVASAAKYCFAMNDRFPCELFFCSTMMAVFLMNSYVCWRWWLFSSWIRRLRDLYIVF